MPQRQAIDRQTATRSAISTAIRSGDLLFVSGQVGSREDRAPEPEFDAQVRRAFQNLAAVLEAARSTTSST